MKLARNILKGVAVEGANDGVVMIQDGLIEYVNPKVAEITGRDAKDSIGVSCGSRVPAGNRPHCLPNRRTAKGSNCSVM